MPKIPLYDVFIQSTDGPVFYMRAPFHTVTTVLHLKRPAIERLQRETTTMNNICDLHDSGRNHWVVQRAVHSLGPDAMEFAREY